MGTNTRALAVGYCTGLAVLLACDLVWLGLVAGPLYREELGALVADPVRPVPAVLFYVLYVAGVVHLVVRPALRAGTGRRRVALDGAVLGLVAYATWDLTNLAVIDGFPAGLVPVDLAWGAALTAVTATAALLVARRLGGGDGLPAPGRRGSRGPS